MKAVVYHEFGGPITIETVPDPSPKPEGAVIQVEATGLCRSDWHGWRGHDPDIKEFPHVPGHEFAGVVVAVGRDVRRAAVGQRITIPFVAGCGACPECHRRNQHLLGAGLPTPHENRPLASLSPPLQHRGQKSLLKSHLRCGKKGDKTRSLAI